MKIRDEFIENSIVAEYIVDLLNEEVKDIDSESFFAEIIGLYFNELKRFSGMFLQITDNLKKGKYQESRNGFLIRDSFSSFTTDICRLRAIIKSLLWGLIKTSSIILVDEIERNKITWKDYDDFDKNRQSDDYHHFLIYQQFKKVETLDELAKFNDFFHQYLVEMVFKMCEIFIRRMTYTIEYLQDKEAFKDTCVEAMLNLKNFREEIEKLKRKPEEFYHRDTENTEIIF